MQTLHLSATSLALTGLSSSATAALIRSGEICSAARVNFIQGAERTAAEVASADWPATACAWGHWEPYTGGIPLWYGAHLHANAVLYFKRLPIYGLVPNILQVGQRSIKLVLLNMCTQDMWV